MHSCNAYRQERQAWARGLRRRVAACTALLAVWTLAACDKLLEVELPGTVDAAALEDPALAQTLIDGVVGDFECAWNTYTAAAAHHSDEWIPASGNLNMRNWGQRKIRDSDAIMATSDCTLNYGLYTPLQTARFQADDVFNRLGEFSDADVPDRVSMQATARAHGGYALIALGEGFCEMAVDGGPLMTPAEVLQLAETTFDDAITIGQQSGNDDARLMGLIGRARVRLWLGDFDGAIADASEIPSGYALVATRGESELRRRNFNVEFINGRDRDFGRNASIAPDYRDLGIDAMGRPTETTANGETPDARVSVANTPGQTGFDFVTPYWYHTKYTTRGTPVPIASYDEAQLIIAEAAARDGDLPTARTAINGLRTAAGLPTLDPGVFTTQDEMIALVIEERRRELFQEAGHRLNDMIRFRGTGFEIPFLGEPGSVHPNGTDQTGDVYGTTTCFPLPLVERNGNPNIP
jgi:hypothetical protein